MATKVLVPRLGEGVDELTIVKWLKQEGQQVTELDPLVEVETDKVVTEIPSPATGTLLRIVIPENSPARVGDAMALIGQPGETLTSDPGKAGQIAVITGTNQSLLHGGQQNPITENHPSADRDHGSSFLSPVVRKMAAEHHIDLSQVHGSGLNGRITRQDVLSYLENPSVQTGIIQPGTEANIINPTDTLLPMTTIRRQIGERMQLSHKTSPHVLTVMEADLSCVTAHRSNNKIAFAADGVNLTYTAYLLAAIAAGLKAQPLVNSSWTEQGILIHSEINIGMATSLGAEGLIVPVLKHADELSLLGIARAVNDLANRARTKKLRPEEVRDGTFTLTNHGSGGSLFAMPIINQPQCGILGVGLIQKRPVVVTDADGNDSIAIRPMVFLSFVFDHRILDGASADSFLVQVKQTLDNWPS
jgi:pyruvate/2-oxoglutarate dehydrogenase complex dihydrolipoamide acyltransferase (E2) component